MRVIFPVGDFLIPVISSGHEAFAKISDVIKSAASLIKSVTYKDNYQHVVSVTGSDQVLATLTVPAKDISDDTIFEIWSLWSCTNSANAKNFKILLNGTAIFDLSQTTIQSMESVRQVRCRGAGNQVATNKATSTPIGVTSSTGVLTLTLDLSAGATLQFVGNRANSADSLAIEACCVKVL